MIKEIVLKKLSREFDRNSYELLLELMYVMYDKDRKFPTYDRDMRIKQSISEFDQVYKSCNSKDYNSMLDIGCGMGYFAAAGNSLGIKKCVGIDLKKNETWDYYCKTKLNKEMLLEFKALDILKDDVGDKFDLVTSWNAFEHFADPLKMLQTMLELLNPGGYLFIRFAPIWRSAAGSHLYRVNQTPWFNIMFSEDILNKFYSDFNIKYSPPTKDNPNIILGNNFLNLWSALDFYILFTSHYPGYNLISIQPIFESYFSWFYDIFKDAFALDKKELMLSGFIVAFKKSS